jgi:trigger factor
MKVHTTYPTTTRAEVTIIANQDELAQIKQDVLRMFQKDAKITGFRPGKAPLEVVEKHTDAQGLQQQFLQEALEALYPTAVRSESLRPVDRPEITIKKFVPFSELEFEAKVTVIREVKLPDYKKIKKQRPIVKVAEKQIDEVISSLRERSAETKSVKRASKLGDQVVINFSGVNSKGEPIKGADGRDYPLILGSKTFIPGFEENLVGVAAGDTKEFTLTFPKDYGMKLLANQKVTFTVEVTDVLARTLPKADDAFAASVGPVSTMKQLKEDIKKELSLEQQRQSDLDYESDLVKSISKKTTVEVPEVLIEDQIERMLRELQQRLVQRGQTIQEFYESEQTTEEKYKDSIRPDALERVKASLVLAEIAQKEDLEVTPEELEIRIQALKSQYKDKQMQQELDKPENRRDIAARMLTEKTVARLTSYATKN